MNKQLFLGTAVVAFIVGGFFLAAVARTVDTSNSATEPLAVETAPVSEVMPTPVIPTTVDDKGSDDDEGGHEDDDEYAGTPAVEPVPTPTPTTPTPTPAKTGYTLAEIAPHNSVSSCWMAIRGKVYDVTKFISKHPGGNQILNGCGKDATSYFEGVRGHLKQTTLNILPGYYKGELIS